jgi:hypothetical protein
MFGRVATIQQECAKQWPRGPSQQIVFIGTKHHPLYGRIRAYERHFNFARLYYSVANRFIRIKFLFFTDRCGEIRQCVGCKTENLKENYKREETRNCQNLIGSLYHVNINDVELYFLKAKSITIFKEWPCTLLAQQGLSISFVWGTKNPRYVTHCSHSPYRMVELL